MLILCSSFASLTIFLLKSNQSSSIELGTDIYRERFEYLFNERWGLFKQKITSARYKFLKFKNIATRS